MENFFFLLSFLFTVILIIGLIKPDLVVRWGKIKKRTRGKVIYHYGLGVILSLGVFFLLNSGDSWLLDVTLIVIAVVVFSIIIGLFEPDLVIIRTDNEKKTRKNVLKYYGLPLLVSFIILVMVIPPITDDRKQELEIERQLKEEAKLQAREKAIKQNDAKLEVEKEKEVKQEVEKEKEVKQEVEPREEEKKNIKEKEDPFNVYNKDSLGVEQVDLNITEEQYNYVVKRYKVLFGSQKTVPFSIEENEYYDENRAQTSEIKTFPGVVDITDYFPLDKNLAYMYGEDRDNGILGDSGHKSLKIREFLGTKIIDGNEVYIKSEGWGFSVKKADKPIRTELDRTACLYVTTDKEILEVGKVKKAFTKDEEVEWYKEPKTEYPHYMKVNEKYELYNKEEVYGKRDEILSYSHSSMRLKGSVDITISDMEFKNCLVIDNESIVGYIDESKKIEYIYYTRMYLAEGVGPVYMDFNIFEIKSDAQKDRTIGYRRSDTYFLGMGKGEWKND